VGGDIETREGTPHLGVHHREEIAALLSEGRALGKVKAATEAAALATI
jgi:hypothetical protein